MPNTFVCITDRTQADVDRVNYLHEVVLNQTATQAELAEYNTDLKGALNYSDLDRIDGNVELLCSLVGVIPASLERDTIPRTGYFNRLLYNVSAIRASGYSYVTTPIVPNPPLNTYQKINDIEKILFDAYTVYEDNANGIVFCGSDMYANNNLLI